STLVVVGMGSLLYFTHVDEQLWPRSVTINIMIICLAALSLPKIYDLLNITYTLEMIICAIYFLFFVYGLLSTSIVIIYFQNVQNVALATTTWWMTMIAVNLFLSLWFAIIVSAVAVKERFDIINEERLRDSLTKLYNRNGFLEKTKDLFNELQHG